MIDALKKLLLRGGELVVALVLALLLFMGFTAIIGLAFPHGTRFQDLISDSALQPNRDTGFEIRLDVAEETSGGFAAWLSNTRRVVKNKRSGTITWHDARSGMALENRHSIQTFGRAAATISFGGEGTLHVPENSLIVVRKLEKRQESRRATMVVLEGGIGGSAGGDSDGNSGVEMEIVTAGGAALVVPAAASRSDFNVTVNPDKTSTFTVLRGTAQVESGGAAVDLSPGTSVTVAASQPPPTPILLPFRPDALSPVDGAELTYATIPPQIAFRWNGDKTLQSHRLTIARDHELSDVVYDGTVEGLEFHHGNLAEGRYYWTVRGVSGWAEGRPSAVHTLSLIRDVDPPQLDVAFPDEPLYANAVRIRGNAEPGSRVFVAEHPVPTDDFGEFELALDLERGLNLVVVEAVDSAGNSAYRSARLIARF